ncbi:hypothetical protein FNV43_RR06189 [Rhamnella rubrinervis]|uniref:Uncharacterized protein n=1 Tax=Rhamnella rubrinervis TaxID=2594499 RepID=A0A8K0ML62_9ROSA|nr:hypothetical protein FNV43_RR06189 [Rhamnella rubrinervis]
MLPMKEINKGVNPQAPHLKDEGTKPYEFNIAEYISNTIDENISNSSADASKSTDKHKIDAEMETTERAILVVAKNGVAELVEEILERYPVAVHDMNADKNIVLLAVENRQPHVYGPFLKKNTLKDILFRKLDKYDNSALQLAATLQGSKPWHISGASLQMQWEVKWYETVKDTATLIAWAQNYVSTY